MARTSSAITLDVFDRKILKTLQEEGRISVVDLANRIGLSATPTQRRMQRLEEEGLIAKYAVRINRKAAGLSLTVFLQLKVEGHHDRNASMLQKRLVEMPEIISCHIVSGDADLIAEVVVSDLEAYENFLMGKLLKLGVIKEVRSFFALRALKVDGPLTVP